MEFINLLKEEWSYHLMNIGILFIFSLYGAYSTIQKKIKLEIFRIFEKKKEKLTDKEKGLIKKSGNKAYLKEFLKAFFALFVIYTIYIVYRSGIFE